VSACEPVRGSGTRIYRCRHKAERDAAKAKHGAGYAGDEAGQKSGQEAWKYPAVEADSTAG